MTKRPTVYDVARHAGVSTATVSYAYSRPGRVAESTVARVMKSADELGYVPRSSARDLAVGRHDTLGLFAFDMLIDHRDQESMADSVPGPPSLWTFPLYVDEVQRGFQLECAHRHKSALIGSGKAGDGGEVINVAGSVDGLAILPGELSDKAICQVARNMPVVLFGRSPIGRNSSAITVDNERAMRMLVDHMVDEHTVNDMEFVGWAGADEVGGRFKYFCEAAHARGVEVSSEPWSGVDVLRGTANEALVKRLTAGRLPSVLVCGQDQIAAIVIGVLQRAAVRVPEDVAVVGFDGIKAGQIMSPPLTTIRQPLEEMGRAAVDILLDSKLRDGARTAVFPPTLLVRRSCGCSDPQIDE